MTENAFVSEVFFWQPKRPLVINGGHRWSSATIGTDWYHILWMSRWPLVSTDTSGLQYYSPMGEVRMHSKKISNDQELIQSDPISCPQNQKHAFLNWKSYAIKFEANYHINSHKDALVITNSRIRVCFFNVG